MLSARHNPRTALRGVLSITLGFGLVLAVCAGLIAAARAIGHAGPDAPTYLEPGPSCAQPCWQGIVPGVSTHEHFLRRVQDASPYTGFASDYGDGIAARIELHIAGALRLADVVRVFGPPERVGCLGADAGALSPGQSVVTATRLYFAGGLIEVDAAWPDALLRVDPSMRVRAVRYYAPGEPVYPVGRTVPWQGFTSTRAYLPCRP